MYELVCIDEVWIRDEHFNGLRITLAAQRPTQSTVNTHHEVNHDLQAELHTEDVRHDHRCAELQLRDELFFTHIAEPLQYLLFVL